MIIKREWKNILKRGAFNMFINKNLDFELSTEESKELIRALNSPACELVNKRKNFFAHGEHVL